MVSGVLSTRPAGRRIAIHGTIQGVGFRPWVVRLARRSGVTGRIKNDAAGVTLEVFADGPTLDRFVERLRTEMPPAAEIGELLLESIPHEPTDTFEIVESQGGEERRISFPADLATCPDCLREIRDPADRRHGYPFTNCTSCGPRYTIVAHLPYDRPATTMAPFEMCPACRAEYEDLRDRRYHAQPNACPACGPKLTLLGPGGARVPGPDPIGAAAAALGRGLLVALKGIGGFHLACDAASDDAVARLRERKRREAKPLAVMTADLEGARRLAELGPEEERILSSVERPIVLARRRAGAPLSAAIAPDNPLVGLLLPYSPLHHLLLDAFRRPLVMTSGNLSEEPIARTNEEAISKLSRIADLFLVHDRDILARADDSVVRVIRGAPSVLRRSRGWVPRAIPLARAVSQPILAVGAQLKNTFCLAVGRDAILGPHIGDLDDLESLASFEESVARFSELLAVSPRIVAHDLHPDFLSTRYALGMPSALKVGVQHHHAHVASAMAEHRLDGPVLALAFDGAGYGGDGTSWGGELFHATYEGYRRLATLRPIALAGGDRAVREVWRIAFALVDDAFGGRAPIEQLSLFEAVPEIRRAEIKRVLRSGLAVASHGAGRLFDAIGALLFAAPESRFEGEIAQRVEHAAALFDGRDRTRYDFTLDRLSEPWQIDLRPAVRAIAGDLIAREQTGAIAARFHRTLIAASATVVRMAAMRFGALPVVLTGGCFQNAILTAGVADALEPDLTVHVHRRVPSGDGGVALGQAVVADALVRRLGS